MKKIKFQVEQAVEEMTNAYQDNGITVTMKEFVKEVYEQVVRTEYTETGMNDKPTNRLQGKAKLERLIEEAIKADKDAMVWVR